MSNGLQSRVKWYIEKAFIVIAALAAMLGISQKVDIPGIENETLVAAKAIVAAWAAAGVIWEALKAAWKSLHANA